MIELLKKYWHFIAIGILAAAFFIGTASFNYLTQTNNFYKWLSPDETANYTFAKLYGQEGKISIYEGYNLYTKGIMFPRSFRNDWGDMKPVSFLGIILIYGKVVSWSSYKILPYLTPFFAAIGLIYYYLLISRFFGKRNALISTFLLAVFPVYVYYSARSMFHNVPFTVFLVIGLYYSVRMGERGKMNFESRILNIESGIRGEAVQRPDVIAAQTTNHKLSVNSWISIKMIGARWSAKIRRFVSRPKLSTFNFQLSTLYPALAGGFIGLALITRTSELLWAGPMLFLLWIFNIRQIGVYKLFVLIFFLLLAFLPVFYWNNILYGSSLSGGYPEMNQSIANIASASGDLVKSTVAVHSSYFTEAINALRDNIFRFGIHPMDSWRKFQNYFLRMFPWLFWPALGGLLMHIFTIRKWRKKHYLYYGSYFFLSLVLVLYYGSWDFHDNPDPLSATIGNSYTRYWLPIYLGAIPLSALALDKVSKWLMMIEDIVLKRLFASSRPDQEMSKQGVFRFIRQAGANGLRCLGVIMIIIFSLYFVIFGSEEGLAFAQKQQIEARYEYDQILQLTESNSALITRYHDKLFFPERKVIVGLFDDANMIAEYKVLTRYLPVYYYNFSLPATDLAYLNSRRLAAFGLRLDLIKKINDKFSLYRLVPVK